MTEAIAAAGRFGPSASDAFAESEAELVERLISLLLALEPFEIKQTAVPGGSRTGPDAMACADGQSAGGEAGESAAADAAGGAANAQTDADGVAGKGSGPGDAVADVVGGNAARGAMSADPIEAREPAPGDAGTKRSVSTRAMLARMRAVLDREAARLGEDGLEGKAAVDQVSLIVRTLEKIDQMERLIAEDQARAHGRTLSAEEREQMRQTVRQLILSAAERLAAERSRDPRREESQPAAAGREHAAAADETPT